MLIEKSYSETNRRVFIWRIGDWAIFKNGVSESSSFRHMHLDDVPYFSLSINEKMRVINNFPKQIISHWVNGSNKCSECGLEIPENIKAVLLLAR